jgi:hypothetical protein
VFAKMTTCVLLVLGAKCSKELRRSIFIGWEAGSLCRCPQKSQETWAFSINVFQGSDLPPLDDFVGFRLFASVFGFCQRNDTRNVTRRERLPSSLVRNSRLKTLSLRSAKP